MKKLMKTAAVPFAVMTAMANVPEAVKGHVFNEGGGNAEQMLEKLTAKVDEMSGDVKATAEKALKEVAA